MRFQLPDGYSVQYVFEPVMSKRPPKGREDCVETLATRALVGRPDRSLPEAQGVAIFNPGDKFSLSVAKEIALGRALKRLLTSRRAPRLLSGGYLRSHC